jgi:predicted amino acid dehydrogenase
VPLIADECQTGTGRTGTFLACEGLQVEPDYVVLSKTLGGGLSKISALLVRAERYVREFDTKHASTYADDAYSSAIALKVLELLDDAALARCRALGERLRAELRALRDRYPDVIADVRGRGLMIGIEFIRDRRSSSFLLEFLASQEDLVFLLAGYLLRVHALRVAPTLGDPFTLRLEPSLLLDEPAIQKTLHALEDVCERLRKDDAAGLAAPMAQTPRAPGPLRSDGRFFAWPDRTFAARQKSAPPVRAGWLCHLINADHLGAVEPSLAKIDPAQRERLLERFVERASPVALNPLDFRSRAGIAGRFYPILLPVTSKWMKASLESGDPSRAQLLVERGVEMARELGCTAVSLGQYTSIVTRNGTSFRPPGMGLTTGNSYTAALAIQAVLNLHQRRGIDPARSVLAVAGASGNIGRACAEILAPFYKRTILLGSGQPGSALRLGELAGRIARSEIAPDAGGLRAADAVVCAVSAPQPPFGPEHFGENCLVCDLSMPPALRPGTAAARPDLCVIGGGIARLPFGEALDVAAFPLPAGRVYACMAEGMLLALENITDAALTGPISTAHVLRVEEMAETHGFELADLKRAGRLEPAPEGLIIVPPR